MDIYRFFHPHHNPRLLSTPVRQLELVELEQAASELRKSLLRMQQRIDKKPVTPILPSHFTDIIKAMDFVSRSIQTLCDAHPGDSKNELRDLVEERSDCAGWEKWAALLQEQLGSSESNEDAHSESLKAVNESNGFISR
ncbi:MAG: hypothetical protein H6619_00120 [Deltaproteobacteria bacterium]|nr:hypothetical protein [Deltaproteobacteria bacterium]